VASGRARRRSGSTCLDAAESQRAERVTSIINLGEAFYRLVRVDRREQAGSLWRMAVRRGLPVSVKEATQRRVRRAAELKADHAIAYADAFAVATALEFEATLVTGDPEIRPLGWEVRLDRGVVAAATQIAVAGRADRFERG
jgi:predicted nucleic acid-binding protein